MKTIHPIQWGLHIFYIFEEHSSFISICPITFNCISFIDLGKCLFNEMFLNIHILYKYFSTVLWYRSLVTLSWASILNTWLVFFMHCLWTTHFVLRTFKIWNLQLNIKVCHIKYSSECTILKSGTSLKKSFPKVHCPQLLDIRVLWETQRCHNS